MMFSNNLIHISIVFIFAFIYHNNDEMSTKTQGLNYRLAFDALGSKDPKC